MDRVEQVKFLIFDMSAKQIAAVVHLSFMKLYQPR